MYSMKFSPIGKMFEGIGKRLNSLDLIDEALERVIKDDTENFKNGSVRYMPGGELSGNGIDSKVISPQKLSYIKESEGPINVKEYRQQLTESNNDIGKRISIKNNTIVIDNTRYPTIEIHEQLVKELQRTVFNYIMKDEIR